MSGVGSVAGSILTNAARHWSFSQSKSESDKRKNVGILGMEVYTPSTFISQEKLEQHVGVSPGKFTIGLGQEGMAICGDTEDVNSLALTVLHSLLEKYEVDVKDVGRLEVGTETLVDKSKSTKTVLMSLFGEQNTNVEGATVINACYGGTAALFNAFSWVESEGWDGRYAIVIAVDIATYERGPARPTCGAGAVAVLIGRDAPLVFDPKEKVTHASHTWDFFKPNPSVEYPTVDGPLSQTCYYRALDSCYQHFCEKIESTSQSEDKKKSTKSLSRMDVNSPDYFVFHAPYNKLVQKSFARLFLIDAKRKQDHQYLVDYRNHEEKKDTDSTNTFSSDDEDDSVFVLHRWLNKPMDETYTDRELDAALKKLAKQLYQDKLKDANIASQKIGNTYTASVFMGLASLIDNVGGRGDLTPGKSMVVFSYGSGAIASMYRLQVRIPDQTKYTIGKMVECLDLMERLKKREEVLPEELDLALETRARMHRAGAPYSPVYPTAGRLFPGTYYLNGIDSHWRRSYSRIPLDAKMDSSSSLENIPYAPPIVLRLAKRDEISTPVTGKLLLTGDNQERCSEEKEQVQRRIACVITGVSAGLPGPSDRPVFDPDNLDRLLTGEQCIQAISGSAKAALLDKNVVQIKRLPDGTVKRIPVDKVSSIIKVAAQLGDIDLTTAYGVPAGLAETMDVAAQVAVAAGMEALKNAGLVGGKSNDPSEWKLPENYRDSTGIVYASSFPAMDAAVGEVMRFLQSKTVGAAGIMRLISALRNRLIRASPDRELSDDDEAAFARLLMRSNEIDGSSDDDSAVGNNYVFDRKFLFRVLVLGNAQLAQLAGCRGPNTQTNAACAGTTQAIGMAQDMLISGRAERVVVIAGDNASGKVLLPWLGSGFRALGAATTEECVEDAALPFDKRRSGMILGAGGIGIVLETEESSQERLQSNSVSGQTQNNFQVRARLLATQYSNSAFHGAALDRKHIASELSRFLSEVELVHGISKAEIATHGVYFSHETSTHASPSSSCAGNEVAALRQAFGDDLLSKMLILNTKGFTGHPMGVSFEDVTAVQVLMNQTVPPVKNYKEKDEYLGDLNISKGGRYACRYALRFAAGFGSQVAFALYATAQYE